MSHLRNSFSKSGYDQEEAYFHQEDQRLIAKQRKGKLELVSSRPDSPQVFSQGRKKTSESEPIILPRGLKKAA